MKSHTNPFSATAFDARDIVNYFRIQSLIEEIFTEAQLFFATKNLTAHTSSDLADLALAYLEGGNPTDAIILSNRVIALEESTLNDPENAANQSEFLKKLESLATVYFILATVARENNDFDKSSKLFLKLKSQPLSTWLESNVYKNEGILYLKKKDLEKATAIFKQGYEFTKKHSELEGSLASFLNYWALAETNKALANNQDPAFGLQLFQQTTELYEKLFKKFNVSAGEREKSHDWQSHLSHRALVLCNIAEKNPDIAAAKTQLEEAEKLAESALAARIKNKADAQRLGDVQKLLGRIHTGLKQFKSAENYFADALNNYRIAYPNKKTDGSEADQIIEVKDYQLSLKNVMQFAGITAPGKLSIIPPPLVQLAINPTQQLPPTYPRPH